MANQKNVLIRLALSFCLFLILSFNSFANVLVISDIDDTIKTSNSVGKWHQSIRFFLKNKPYYEMRDIFVEIENEARKNGQDSEFYYVTAAPRIVFNAKKFLKKYHFPYGPVTMKKLFPRQNTYQYKTEKIREILEQTTPYQFDQIYFFGDNSSYDALVYRDLISEFGLKNAVVFIRDVKTSASPFDSELKIERLQNTNYFLSEIELIGHPALAFLSKELKHKIFKKHQKNSLIPSYTLKTYFRRASYILKCKIFHTNSKSCNKEKKKKAKRYWHNFQSSVFEIVKKRETLPIED